MLKLTSKRWFAQGTYSYVSSRGTTQNALSGTLSNPSQVELAYGDLGTDVNHQVKLAAYWEIPDDPWTTTVGLASQGFSGYPLSRYYWQSADLNQAGGAYGLLKEPRGEYGDTEPFWTLDLQVMQEIVVPKGKLNVRFELSNITDNHYAVAVSSGYISAQNRYVITSHQGGISGSLALGYEY